MRARSGFWASTSSAFPEKNGVLGAALRASAPLRCRAAAEVQRSAFSLFGGSRQVVGVVAGHYTARTGLVARAVGVRTSEGEGSGSRSEGRGRNGGREREKKSAAGGGSAGGRGALYNQFLDLLGQQGNFSLAKAAASRGTRAKAGAGGSKPGKAGQIMKKRSGGKHKNFVEAQRHFYRQCVQQNRLELALEYVETLNEGKAFEERGMGYQGLLACCVRLNALDAAVRVHSEQVELTGGSNAFAYSMLISLAGKIAARSNPGGGGGGARQKGRGEDVNPTYIHTYLGRGLCDDEEGALPGDPLARYVSHFFEMSVREGCCNVVVCNAVLDAYGRNSHCEEVFKLHQRMRGELGIAENAETFNSLMQTATRAGWYSLVFELRREMESMGIEPSERTVSIMFAAAAKAQQHARGRKGEALGDGGGALSAALQSGVANWAFTVLDSAREGGIEVNNHILSSLFSACASEGKGINRCTKLLFWHMENAGRAAGPNVNVWCSFIKLCGACGEVDLAVQVCERYCDKPLGPYVRSSLCAAIATAAAKAGAGEVEGFERYCDKAIEWHENYHITNNTRTIVPQNYIWSVPSALVRAAWQAAIACSSGCSSSFRRLSCWKISRASTTSPSSLAARQRSTRDSLLVKLERCFSASATSLSSKRASTRASSVSCLPPLRARIRSRASSTLPLALPIFSRCMKVPRPGTTPRSPTISPKISKALSTSDARRQASIKQLRVISVA